MPDVFAALGDATRRQLLEEVSARGSATATQLAAELPITRQAVTKHLHVLADAGLVRAERAGRETRYAPAAAPLSDATGWIDKLAALQRAAERRAR
ncbi:MAG TPA: metalloregulator ArsR/SmtB family transcription factor [Solirubrobacteraceae bacterium]